MLKEYLSSKETPHCQIDTLIVFGITEIKPFIDRFRENEKNKMEGTDGDDFPGFQIMVLEEDKAKAVTKACSHSSSGEACCCRHGNGMQYCCSTKILWIH